MIYCKLVLVLNIAINKLCFVYLCTNVALGWTMQLDYHREQGIKEDIMNRVENCKICITFKRRAVYLIRQ